jgi:hypothetical protein
MSGIGESLFGQGGIAGKLGLKGTGGAVVNGGLGYALDPANISGAFGNNVGPGAFMNPNGQGGALYPGGPGLPGGNKTGEGLNAAAGTIVGSIFGAPELGSLAGGGASAGGITQAAAAGASDPFNDAAVTGASSGSGGLWTSLAPSLINAGSNIASKMLDRPAPAQQNTPARPGGAATPQPVQPISSGLPISPLAALSAYNSFLKAA